MQYKPTKKQRNIAFELVFGDASVMIDEILEKYGISGEEFAKWLGGGFADYLTSLSDCVSTAEAARIMHTLAKESKNGDVRSAKLFFELLRVKQKNTDESDADSKDIEMINQQIRGDAEE